MGESVLSDAASMEGSVSSTVSSVSSVSKPGSVAASPTHRYLQLGYRLGDCGIRVLLWVVARLLSLLQNTQTRSGDHLGKVKVKVKFTL